MSRIPVLFVQNNPGIGGGMTCLYNHLSHIDQGTFRVHVAYTRHHEYIDLVEALGDIETHLLPKRFHFQGISNILALLIDEIPHAHKLIGLCKRIKPRLIVTNNDICQHWGTIIAARILRLPIIVTMRGGSYRYFSKTDRFLANHCDAIVAVSRTILEIYEGLPKNKCNIIYDGVRTTLFGQKIQSGFCKKWAYENNDMITVSMLGRIDPWKGHDLFLDAAISLLEIYKNVKYLIVGRTMEGQIDYYEDLRKKLINAFDPARIIFAGFHLDVPDVLRGTDILVHATKIAEPFGMVVLEGMASGIPVIASKLGGPSEIIDDGENGYLIDPNSLDEIVESLAKLIENQELRQRVGQNARAKVEQCFRVESTVEKWKQLILTTLEKSEEL